jgi:hypothetical protein
MAGAVYVTVNMHERKPILQWEWGSFSSLAVTIEAEDPSLEPNRRLSFQVFPYAIMSDH